MHLCVKNPTFAVGKSGDHTVDNADDDYDGEKIDE